MKNKKINLAMMAGMILMSMGCEAKGKVSQSSIPSFIPENINISVMVKQIIFRTTAFFRFSGTS